MLEGRSYPDVYIEGKDYVIIIEGKWTEGIKTRTANLKSRNQMIRHIQGAFNIIDSQKTEVIAFYIVDGNSSAKYLEKFTKDAFSNQIKSEAIEVSREEKERLEGAFKGCITWQEVKKVLPEVEFLTKEEID